MLSKAPETTADSAPALICTAPIPVLMLRGSAALSPFRQERLMGRLRAVLPAIESVHAEYRHFAALHGEISATDRQMLERLLSYGPKRTSVAPRGELLLVVPRLGTLSPWSSKATDIARHCALKVIRRLERGVAWFVATRGDAALDAGERQQLVALIHDRMTESVLPS